MLLILTSNKNQDHKYQPTYDQTVTSTDLRIYVQGVDLSLLCVD